MEILLVLVLLLTVVAAQAPASKEVPVAEEPSHHLVLENQYTRTYKVEVAPGKATLLHRHDHDYVFVAVGDADISNEVPGKPRVEQKLKDGDVNFAPGGFAHVARNLAPTPFRNVTIEVLRKTTRVISPFGDDFFHAHYSHDMASGATDLGETDAVRVTREEIGQGSRIRSSQVPNHMMVALNDLHLKGDVTGKGSSDIQLKAGDVLWVKPGGKQTLTNVGKQPARFVVVEFR